jgi:hypothetical protein
MSEDRLKALLKAGGPLVSEELGTERAALLEEAAWRRYRALAPGAPKFAQRINRELFILGLPLLALYRVLREDFGVGEAPAVALLERVLGAVYRPLAGSLLGTAAVNVMFGVGFVRNIGLRMAFEANEPEGFRFEKIEDEGAVFGFDVRECALVKYLKAQGAPEIVPMICRIDDIMAERLRGMTLKRTGTIGMGAERCDFRYVQLRKKT